MLEPLVDDKPITQCDVPTLETVLTGTFQPACPVVEERFAITRSIAYHLLMEQLCGNGGLR